MNKILIASALTAAFLSAPAHAGPARLCKPIAVVDAEGDAHEVQVRATNCAQVSNFVRGYALENRIVASQFARVVVGHFGGGVVQVFAGGIAETGIYHRGGGNTLVDNIDGGVAVDNRGEGTAEVRNRGRSQISVKIGP